jgi:hypothetical protein
VTHAAWTDHGEMRAIVVEFAGADDEASGGILGGTARRLPAGEAGTVTRGEGRLADTQPDPGSRDRTTGEPL